MSAITDFPFFDNCYLEPLLTFPPNTGFILGTRQTPSLVDSLTAALFYLKYPSRTPVTIDADKRGDYPRADFHAREIAEAPYGARRSMKAITFYGREINWCRTLLT
jgi:hypothetical protein